MKSFCFSVRLVRTCLSRYQSINRFKSFYATTPIFYVNSKPHIGHLYTAALADASCRWRRFVDNQESVKLVTGTDEHGLKVSQAAQAESLDPQQFCDQVSSKFLKLFDDYSIDFSDFVRTSEERHKDAVRELWLMIEKNGHIYKGGYEGWYCTSDEAFLTSKQVTKCENGRHISIESGNLVEWTKEENYMFKLTHFLPAIRSWIESNPDVIHPAHFRDQALRIIEDLTEDLSVSRPSSRVRWGIPVPGDDSQTVYVWMDALSNYLTAAGFPDTKSSNFTDMWPADVHFIGKDILKFHAVYWPSFLLAAGLPLPGQIVVHSHWLYDGHKMSKSRGNVVDPVEAARLFTTPGFKYFLLRQSHLESNCSYTDRRVLEVVNGELANDIGNSLNRALAKGLNKDQTYPCFDAQVLDYDTSSPFAFSIEDRDFIDEARALPDKVESFASEFRYQDAIFHIMDVSRKANLVIHRNSLWNYDRADSDQARLFNAKLYCVYESLRVCGLLLQPFCPEVASKLLDKLGVPDTCRSWCDARHNFLPLNGEVDKLCGQPLPVSKDVLFRSIPPLTTSANRPSKKKKKAKRS